MKQLVKNFLFLNILGLIALYATSGWVPHKLIAHVADGDAASIEVEGVGQLFIGNSGDGECSLYVPSEKKNDRLGLCVADGSRAFVESLRHVRCSFLVKEWKNVGWVTNNKMTIAVSGDDGRLYLTSKGWFFVGAVELIMILVSLVVGLAPRLLPTSTRQFTLSSWAAGPVAFSAFVMFFAPAQVLLSTGNALGGKTLGVWFAIALVAFLTLLVTGVLSYAATRFSCLTVGKLNLLSATLLTFAIYGYLEAGVLSIGCPPLHGDLSYYCNVKRGIADAVVLPFVFTSICALAIWFGESLKWIVLSLCVMGGGSLFDVRKPFDESAKTSDMKRISKVAALKSCVHSAKKNVAVYVLDCVATPHALEVLRRAPEIARELDGFTAFTNNVGMHCFSLQATGGLATGRYYDDPKQAVEYATALYSTNSFIGPYLERKASVVVSSGAAPDAGVANLPLLSEMESDRSGNGKRRLSGQLQWSLGEVVRFRLTPFLVKRYMGALIFHGWEQMSGPEVERNAYKIIANAPIMKDSDLTFQYWHTDGSHEPLSVDHNGRYTENLKDGFEAKVEKTWFVLKQFAELIRTLKSRGLYDSTFIVLTADHGSAPLDADGKDSDMPFDWGFKTSGIDYIPSRALPILWVKPLGAHGKIQFSNLPTSHCKLHDLFKKLANQDLDGDAVQSVLETRSRLYRIDDTIDTYDCRVDEKGRPSFRKNERGRKLKPIEYGKVYSLHAGQYEWQNCMEIRVAKFTEHNGPLRMYNCAPATMRISLASPAPNQKLTLWLAPSRAWEFPEGATHWVKITGAGGIFVGKYDKANFKEHVALPVELDVIPDELGQAQLTFETPISVEFHAVKLGKSLVDQ